jgi:hypothetical protein
LKRGEFDQEGVVVLLIMSVFDESQAAASAIATPDIAATPQSIDHHTLL